MLKAEMAECLKERKKSILYCIIIGELIYLLIPHARVNRSFFNKILRVGKMALLRKEISGALIYTNQSSSLKRLIQGFRTFQSDSYPCETGA